jgi:hypothetical protein
MQTFAVGIHDGMGYVRSGNPNMPPVNTKQRKLTIELLPVRKGAGR